MRNALFLLGFAGFFGCAGAVPIVRSAAVEAFQCPAERVGIARIGGGRYRALGCGQRAVYECAVADGYVCTMEAEIQRVETSDQRLEVNDHSLNRALRQCNLGAVSVVIVFDGTGAASSLDFSEGATSQQRSCVAHIAANHVGTPGEVRYPSGEDTDATVPAQ